MDIQVYIETVQKEAQLMREASETINSRRDTANIKEHALRVQTAISHIFPELKSLNRQLPS